MSAAVDAYSNNRIDCFRCSIRMVESFLLVRCNDDCWEDDDCVLKILRKMAMAGSHCLIVCYQIDA